LQENNAPHEPTAEEIIDKIDKQIDDDRHAAEAHVLLVELALYRSVPDYN
jgi:hypothetical protein